jgi:hypothetical protein
MTHLLFFVWRGTYAENPPYDREEKWAITSYAKQFNA